jgi:8-oxo-dGTP pyrophosphatase MutT (NUDIX family)
MKRDVAVAILYNQQGEMLLQHRSEDAARLPGYWGLFGGGIDLGENHFEAVVREINEELCYRLMNHTFIYTQFRETGDKYVFVEPIDDSQTLTLCEGQGMGWYTYDQTKSLKIADHDQEAITKAYTHIEQKLS